MAEPVAVAPGRCHVTTHRQSLPGPRSSTREPPLSQAAPVRSCASVTSGRCSSAVCMRYRWANAVARERSSLALSIPEPEAGVAPATTATVTASSAASGSTAYTRTRRPTPS